jgi:transposase
MAHTISRGAASVGGDLREETKETVAIVIRHLRAGKSPKEIACTMHVSWSCVQAIIYRYRIARSVFIETYRLRHPKQSGPPQKIILPLDQAQL